MIATEILLFAVLPLLFVGFGGYLRFVLQRAGKSKTYGTILLLIGIVMILFAVLASLRQN